MAEAIVNTRLGHTWEAVSAGTAPSGYIHPLALKALEEIGISHEGESKNADTYRDVEFDLVITVCDSAAEHCPMWLGRGKKQHIGFIDPAEATGTEEEKMQVFRQVRDEIAEQIPSFLKNF